MISSRIFLISCLLAAGCDVVALARVADLGSDGPQTLDLSGIDQELDNPQLPPMGDRLLLPWLNTGYYKSWKCEVASHPARPNGAHGTNRICSNDLLSQNNSGEFPVGAAAVKELYSGAQISGYAVYRKLAPGGCETYYHYERFGLDPNGGGFAADGVAPSLCVNCHSQAGSQGNSGHDCVYTIVK